MRARAVAAAAAHARTRRDCDVAPAAKLHPGCYALKVYGNLAPEMVDILEENGIAYTPNEEDD